jgi:hypothetical protein
MENFLRTSAGERAALGATPRLITRQHRGPRFCKPRGYLENQSSSYAPAGRAARDWLVEAHVVIHAKLDRRVGSLSRALLSTVTVCGCGDQIESVIARSVRERERGRCITRRVRRRCGQACDTRSSEPIRPALPLRSAIAQPAPASAPRRQDFWLFPGITCGS